MKKKKGFASMAIVYTFLIVFLVLMASFLSSYVNRNKFNDKVISEVKEELNNKYYQNIVVEER